jgi:hypothetical protein
MEGMCGRAGQAAHAGPGRARQATVGHAVHEKEESSLTFGTP